MAQMTDDRGRQMTDEGPRTTDDGRRTTDGWTPGDGWVEIRGSGGRLLCRLDVGRLLLEVKPKGGAVELVDLRPLLVNYELRITNWGRRGTGVDGVDGVDGREGAALGGKSEII